MIVWVPKLAVLGIHQDSLTLFGGLPGIRDEGALLSALARPENKHAYGEHDLSVLAAAYAFGISKNHPFSDGNKRTALGTLIAFLGLNRHRIVVDKIALTQAMLALTSSDLPEADFAVFVKKHLQKR
jgi:death-on-curing protein